MRPPSRRAAWGRLAIVIALVLALDQGTKALIEHNLVPGERAHLLPGIDLTRVLNDGVAFGFLGGSGKAGILVVTAIALIAVVGWYATDPLRKGAWVAVGLVAGGALGNLVDRFRPDAVTDFISLPLWPTFNVADIGITLGAASLVVAALLAVEDAPKSGEGSDRDTASTEPKAGGADPGA